MGRKGCRACQADAERHEYERYYAHEAADVCARVFGGVTNWWDKEPGYVRNEIKAALRGAPALKPHKRIPRFKGDKAGPYAPQDYTLPRPTLAQSSKRLANAQIEVWEDVTESRRVWDSDASTYTDAITTEPERVQLFTGPKAAEQFITYRREQLGLDLEVKAAA
jgi:hypothetical protein